MIKIIKAGSDPADKPIIVTCYHCKTKFSYQKEDIQSDQRDGDYIVCPTCKQFINTK